ncbi:MAG: glycosyltransferase [Thermoanaerobacterium sp.]|nr:glycosyltransferase [Thermoanaerobacterium sp.]
MSRNKKISVYIRNKETPSSYYRIIQYLKKIELDKSNIYIREIAPDMIYKKRLNSNNSNFFKKYLIGIIYYLTMVVRLLYYLLIDNIDKPDYVIVSKTFCPGYTPLLIRILLRRVADNTILYWDFDDNIFISNEISKAQANILKEKSKKIIVTHEYLKSKIDKKYHDKVILLPTTDGDLQGFDERILISRRKELLEKQIRLIWVGTSVNLFNLYKIIHVLDRTAENLKKVCDKSLVLTIVCNKPLEAKVNHLIIRNILWNRDIAKYEIYNAHIGIMPLILNEYSLGKGGFKLIQYISTGLPVIASNVGFNKEIVDTSCGILVDDEVCADKWEDAIIKITYSLDVWEKYSIGAYKRWKKLFSFEHNLNVWKHLLDIRG